MEEERTPPVVENFHDRREAFVASVAGDSASWVAEQLKDYSLSQEDIAYGSRLLGNLAFGVSLVDARLSANRRFLDIAWDDTKPSIQKVGETEYYPSPSIWVQEGDSSIHLNRSSFVHEIKKKNRPSFLTRRVVSIHGGAVYDNAEDAMLFAGVEEAAHQAYLSRKGIEGEPDVDPLAPMEVKLATPAEYRALLWRLTIARKHFKDTYYPQLREMYIKVAKTRHEQKLQQIVDEFDSGRVPIKWIDY